MFKYYKIRSAQGLGFSHVSLKGRNNFVIGYFQSFKWASDSKVLGELRQLTLSTTSKTLARYRELASIEKPLIVHIRLGDYKTQTSFGIPGKAYYETGIRRLWSTGKYNRIWVFSDEPELAIKKLPLDLSENFRVVHEIDNSTAATLEVMRLGHGYVIANSSFSWWGAFLSTFQNPSVICPTPWFVGESSPVDLIPPSWVQIPISIEQ